MPFKISFAFLLLIFILPPGCVPSNKKVGSTQPELDTHPFDTLQKIRIDSIVDQINVGVKEQGPPYLLAFPMYHPHDTIEYWTFNDEPQRISLTMKTGETIIWPTFFVLNGELIFVRYRASYGNSPIPFAEESMVYLKDGMIVYCEERRKRLLPGETAGSLRLIEYTDSKRSLLDIENDYKKYWLTIKDALIQQTGKSFQ